MTSLLDRLLRLRLASSLDLNDGAARATRIAELRSLLAEIAVGTNDGASRDGSTGESVLPKGSSAPPLKQPAHLSA